VRYVAGLQWKNGPKIAWNAEEQLFFLVGGSWVLAVINKAYSLCNVIFADAATF